MITVLVQKNVYKISGHAFYDLPGKDIVCASVSSVVYTTINAIMNIKEDAIEYIDDTDIIIKIITHTKVVDKLLKNMLDILIDLSEQYPENIKIVKGE